MVGCRECSDGIASGRSTFGRLPILSRAASWPPLRVNLVVAQEFLFDAGLRVDEPLVYDNHADEASSETSATDMLRQGLTLSN